MHTKTPVAKRTRSSKNILLCIFLYYTVCTLLIISQLRFWTPTWKTRIGNFRLRGCKLATNIFMYQVPRTRSDAIYCRFRNRIYSSFIQPSIYTSHYSTMNTINTWTLNTYPQTTHIFALLFPSYICSSSYSRNIRNFISSFDKSDEHCPTQHKWCALSNTDLTLYNAFNFMTHQYWHLWLLWNSYRSLHGLFLHPRRTNTFSSSKR